MSILFLGSKNCDSRPKFRIEIHIANMWMRVAAAQFDSVIIECTNMVCYMYHIIRLMKKTEFNCTLLVARSCRHTLNVYINFICISNKPLSDCHV